MLRPDAGARTQVLVALLALLLSVGTVLLFISSCGNGFVYDDEPMVAKDSLVQLGLSADGLRAAFTTMFAANWHPLTWVSLQLDYELHGLRPAGFHLTNVFLHALNASLLFTLLFRLTGRVWCSAAVAALFAVHPLHVESVAWISERKDVLSTFFWFLTTHAYVTYARRGHWILLLPVCAFFSLGLMAKSMLVTLPVTLLLFDFWPLGRLRATPYQSVRSANNTSRLLLEKVPLFVLSILSAVTTVCAQRLAASSQAPVPLSFRIENGLVASVLYLAKTFWPIHLAAFYPYPAAYPAWQVVVAVLVLVGISVLIALIGRPYLIVGWLWYLVTLVPVLGFVPVLGGHAYADRYTYVPLIGIFIMLVWGAADLVRIGLPRPVASTVAALAVAAASYVSMRQIGVWQDDLSLWTHALRVTTGNYFAHNNRGVALERRNEGQSAMAEYSSAIRARPDYASAYDNRGLLYERKGDLRAAIKDYESAVHLDSSNAGAWSHLGKALGKTGRWQEALQALSTSVELNPNLAGARINYGAALLQCGRSGEAIAVLNRAVALDPDSGEAWHQLGTAYMLVADAQRGLDSFSKAIQRDRGMGRYAYALGQALMRTGHSLEARRWYDRGLALDPRWPEQANQAAWLLATSSSAPDRNGVFARYLAEQACQATNERNPDYLDTLAASCAEAGDFNAAVSTGKKAVVLLAGSSEQDRAAGVQKRLHLYEKGIAFHAAP
jgi:tetratricopeptide (TPR) repeat protein